MTPAAIRAVRAAFPRWNVAKPPDNPRAICLWPVGKPQPDFIHDHHLYSSVSYLPKLDLWEGDPLGGEPGNFQTLIEATEYATGDRPRRAPQRRVCVHHG